MPTKVQSFIGSAAKPYIANLARLRIEVFRDYPYLYEGDLKYEEKYLQTYTDCDQSLVVLCFDGEHVVGASTAIPLYAETPEIKKPFLEAGIDPKTVLYFGESVLRKSFRGFGIGKEFFEHRERYARSISGITCMAFCGVVRKDDDKRRPQSYTKLDAFWQARGFSMQPGMNTQMSWKEIGEEKESPKLMQFWLKEIS